MEKSALEDGDNTSAWTMRGSFDAVLSLLDEGEETLLMLAAEEFADISAESPADTQQRQAFQVTADAQQKVGEQDDEMVRGLRVRPVFKSKKGSLLLLRMLRPKTHCLCVHQTPGTKVWVAQQPGKGVGTYVSFERKLIGANVHKIKFETGATKEIKLKEVYWVVLSAPGE